MKERKIRIKIKDLPKDIKITREEMRKIKGGIDTVPLPEVQWFAPRRKWWL